MIKVLVADDHAIVREGIRQILSQEGDIELAYEAGDGGEVLAEAMKNDYHVAVLDISMPGGNILDILKQLKTAKPDMKVLIHTMHPEQQYAVRVLKSGASGYLTKDSAPHELVRAIRKVHGGGKYVSAELAENLASLIGGDYERPPHELLSDREYQILCLMASGKTVSQIADDLALSVKTVSTYRTRVLEKMNMKTNAELIYYAVKNELVD
jgi:DNA-binding NarL/FixJ family response regulator